MKLSNGKEIKRGSAFAHYQFFESSIWYEWEIEYFKSDPAFEKFLLNLVEKYSNAFVENMYLKYT